MPSNRNEPITRSGAGEPEIEVHGARLIATTAGALYWPAEEMLIVADLHFEKGAALARRGVLLPPYDTRTTLKRLQGLCRKFEPKEIVSLGDAFHESGADAGGLNVLDVAFDGLFGALTAWVIGARGVYPIASRLLVPEEADAPRQAAG